MEILKEVGKRWPIVMVPIVAVVTGPVFRNSVEPVSAQESDLCPQGQAHVGDPLLGRVSGGEDLTIAQVTGVAFPGENGCGEPAGGYVHTPMEQGEDGVYRGASETVEVDPEFVPGQGWEF